MTTISKAERMIAIRAFCGVKPRDHKWICTDGCGDDSTFRRKADALLMADEKNENFYDGVYSVRLSTPEEIVEGIKHAIWRIENGH